MAYALSITDIETVKQQIHDELVAKAYLLEDSMFEDLGFKVTTDVENIDVSFFLQSQIFLPDIHHQPEPLLIICVPEDDRNNGDCYEKLFLQYSAFCCLWHCRK